MTDNATVAVALGVFPAIVRNGLEHLLRAQGFHVVASNLEPAELIRLVGRSEAEVILLHESCARGASTFEELRGEGRDTRVLVCTSNASRQYCIRLLEFGATACFSVNASERQIAEVVRMAADGRYLLVSIADHSGAPTLARDLSHLTTRELSVLQLIGAGNSNAQIALKLQISIETARSHAAHIYKKLGVAGRRELLIGAPGS